METVDIKKGVGRRVRERRREGGMNQGELAGIAGLHQGHVSDIERGHRDPSLTTLHRLAIALDISLSELVEGL